MLILFIMYLLNSFCKKNIYGELLFKKEQNGWMFLIKNDKEVLFTSCFYKTAKIASKELNKAKLKFKIDVTILKIRQLIRIAKH
jgi:hypothetical protein